MSMLDQIYQDQPHAAESAGRAESGAGGVHRSWLLVENLRLEILMAFVCGYIGRVVLVSVSSSWPRRRTVFPSEEADGVSRSRRPIMGGRSLASAWFGGGGSAPMLDGYSPVSDVPLEA